MKRPPGEAMLCRARDMRRDATDAEKLLWRYLRSRQIKGAKFRRQLWLGGYIVDFACIEARLVVEADGEQHGGEKDARRTKMLTALGYRVLRFWNNDILQNIDGVLEAIAEGVAVPSPSHSASPSPSHSAPPSGPLPLPEAGEGFKKR